MQGFSLKFKNIVINSQNFKLSPLKEPVLTVLCHKKKAGKSYHANSLALMVDMKTSSFETCHRYIRSIIYWNFWQNYFVFCLSLGDLLEGFHARISTSIVEEGHWHVEPYVTSLRLILLTGDEDKS